MGSSFCRTGETGTRRRSRRRLCLSSSSREKAAKATPSEFALASG